jgi:hypothetical protein
MTDLHLEGRIVAFSGSPGHAQAQAFFSAGPEDFQPVAAAMAIIWKSPGIRMPIITEREKKFISLDGGLPPTVVGGLGRVEVTVSNDDALAEGDKQHQKKKGITL